MPYLHSEKVAVVTGSSRGIGKAIALRLASEGANVAVCARSERSKEELPGSVGETAAAIQSLGRRALAIRMDVTNDREIEAMVQKVMNEFGRVDILVNNVGVSGPKGTAVEVDMVEWARGMEVNVASMVTMAKFAIPAMLKNEGDGYWKGSIVNLGSVAGLRGGTPNLLYPTTKGAVVNMTRAMAAHHGKDGIRVNCVCPGMYEENVAGN